MQNILDSILLSDYPSTRYQGSKRKLLPWIWDCVKELNFKSVLDAFGGSSSVSYLFKRMRKDVTYNDLLHFNYIIGKALIENNIYKLRDHEIEWLLERHNGIKYSSFITDNFNGKYYLEKENQWLDTVNSNILQMTGADEFELTYKKSLALYSLFQSSMSKRPFNLFHRANLSLRTRKIKRSFGNKTTWEKPFDVLFREFAWEANDLILNLSQNCRATNFSAFDIDPYGFDLVYLDPPYFRTNGSNETSNYYRCYHFLEGMSQYSNWPASINSTNGKGYFPSVGDDIYNTFEILFEKFKKSIIVVSYKRGGVPSVEFLVSVLKKIKKSVRTHSIHYSYALNHQNGDAKRNREVLIIAK